MHLLNNSQLFRPISFILVCGLLFVGLGTACSNETDGNEVVLTEITYKVPEMHCDGCVRSISTALSQLPGVDSVNVSLDNYTAYVKVDTLRSSTSTLKETIEGLGYSAEVGD